MNDLLEKPGPGRSPDLSGDDQALLVSVVVAAHNAERFIEETCRSILAQTYTSIELIVVDDGSTDRTGDIVRSLAASDPRVRLIRQQNLGVAAARNCAIAAAAGEYIAPVDADDLWHPTKIERQVRRMQESGPETGLVYCWWIWVDQHSAVLDRGPRWRVEGRVLEKLAEVNFTGNASVPLYRRSFIEKHGGYDSKLRDGGCEGCEDWDLALRIAERHAVSCVAAVLVGYRRRTDSMSTGFKAMSRSRDQVMAALGARQPSLAPTVFQRSAGQFALHLAGVAYWSGDYAGACRWALHARPMRLGAAIVPYVARMIAKRLLRFGPSRPVLTAKGGQFDESALPEPHIPYDRIFARRWRRKAQADAPETSL